MSHVSLHTNEVSMLQKEMPRLMTCSTVPAESVDNAGAAKEGGP
jgi:hypothetical protein